MKKQKDKPNLPDELAAMQACWQAISKLGDYETEFRIARFILDRLKADRARNYGED